MDGLDWNIFYNIVLHLDLKSATNFISTCKYFHSLSKNDKFSRLLLNKLVLQNYDIFWNTFVEIDKEKIIDGGFKEWFRKSNNEELLRMIKDILKIKNNFVNQHMKIDCILKSFEIADSKRNSYGEHEFINIPRCEVINKENNCNKIFYDVDDFKEWADKVGNSLNNYNVKYHKGLGDYNYFLADLNKYDGFALSNDVKLNLKIIVVYENLFIIGG